MSIYSLTELEERFPEELLIGVDEAGVGALAGPMTASAVIMDPLLPVPGINDSKRLSPSKRESIAEKIKRDALYYSVCLVSHTEVDSLGIKRASDMAKRRAVQAVLEKLLFDQVQMKPLVLVDGDLFITGLGRVSQRAFPKGDNRSVNIAAASVLAKVEHDAWMNMIAKKYPRYLFQDHKGYGTQYHMEKLANYGPCPIHRRCLDLIRQMEL